MNLSRRTFISGALATPLIGVIPEPVKAYRTLVHENVPYPLLDEVAAHMGKIIDWHMFEVNDAFTRHLVTNFLRNYLSERKDLYDWLVICDERNNTPIVVDSNDLVLECHLKFPRNIGSFFIRRHAVGATIKGSL